MHKQLQINGANYYRIMADNKLRLQRFRANDLVDNGGKQFELGKNWCEDFFGISSDTKEVTLFLTFKPLNKTHKGLDGTKIELLLSDVTARGDRKAYANSEQAGCSQIKDLFINKLHLNVNDNQSDYFALYKLDSYNYLLYYVPELLYDNFIQLFKTETPQISVERKPVKKELICEKSFQQIFYGAPGTGKSHAIKELAKGAEVIRTTFHPDSDYSTFVGAYKPTTKSEPKYTAYGEKAVIIKDADGNPIYEDKIVYEFVSQAFLQAYVNAWKRYAWAQDGEAPKEQYLVIEEINRGNCAQIFGDLFQLLDRNGSGFSDYPIKADNDMKKQLAKAFAGLEIAQRDRINSLYKDNEKDIVGQVLSGEKLLLPNNLYIWATMNTSDQSLFPIDSAFKRRWDWQYMPIGKGYDNNGNEYKWFVEIAGKKYSWWSFLEKINAQIAETTQSEDKKLGFFFCKAEDNKISAEKFVGKVIFYLWNDVFKDYGFEREIFKDIDGTELSFAKFYKADINGNTIIQEDKVEVFLNNLKVELIDSADSTEDEEDDDGNKINTPSTRRDYTKYSINGMGAYGKNKLAAECVKKYIELNPLKTADEVMNEWLSLGNIVPHFIESKEQYEARTDNSKRSLAVQCGDTILYVAHDGYGSNGKVLVLKDAVNKKNWGITIEEA